MKEDRMMEIDDVDDPGSLPLYPLLDSNIPPCNMKPTVQPVR